MDFKVGDEPQKGQVSSGVSVSLTSVTLGYSTSKHYQVVLCSPEPFLMHKPKTFIPTHTHPFNGPFSGTAWVSWYQKGKTNLDFTELRDSGSGISWAICKSAPCSRQRRKHPTTHSRGSQLSREYFPSSWQLSLMDKTTEIKPCIKACSPKPQMLGKSKLMSPQPQCYTDIYSFIPATYRFTSRNTCPLTYLLFFAPRDKCVLNILYFQLLGNRIL